MTSLVQESRDLLALTAAARISLATSRGTVVQSLGEEESAGNAIVVVQYIRVGGRVAFGTEIMGTKIAR